MILFLNRPFLFAVIFSAVMCIAIPSFGYDIYVTKTEDTNDGLCDADCSLREAIIKANGLFDEHPIIYVPEGNYWILLEGINENDSASGDLDINNSMTIVGEGMDATIINGLGELGYHDRVFHVNAPGKTVEFENLGIYAGYVEFANQQNPSGGGVLITNAAKVHFFRCHIWRNFGAFSGGAIYFKGNSIIGNELTITESVVESNEAGLVGGALYAEYTGLIIDSSTITGNSAWQGSGGIYAKSTVTKIINSTFYKNVAPEASEMCFTSNLYALFSHSTLVSSDLDVGSGNIIYHEGQGFPLYFRNSIVWGRCSSDTSEFFFPDGGNMGEPSNSCGFGENDIILEADPKLLSLGDYGGPTPTAPPALNSLAIDKGVDDEPNQSIGPNPLIDQRGIERPQAVKGIVPAYDIGSVERESLESLFKRIINELRYVVKALSIRERIKKRLFHKIANIDRSYDKGKFRAAINKLKALNNSVEAQRGKSLTVNQADYIIFLSNEAIAFLKNED